MKNTTLIFTRNGENKEVYEEYTSLTPRGVEEIKEASEKIKTILSGSQNFLIVTSSTVEVFESVRMIARELDYPVDKIRQHKNLNGNEKDLYRFLDELFKSSNTEQSPDFIIIISRIEALSKLVQIPSYTEQPPLQNGEIIQIKVTPMDSGAGVCLQKTFREETLNYSWQHPEIEFFNRIN